MLRDSRRWIAALALVGAATCLLIGLPRAGSASASQPPFVDTKATGLITLCNRQGQRMTSGSTLDTPLMGKAISSSPAPTGFNGGNATLYAFQPIQYVSPGFWSGSQVTVASTYSNAAYPVVAGSDGDEPLVAFVSGHPLHWDGLLQLRIYFTGGTNGDYHATYPQAVLRVHGTHWTAVEEGSLPCDIAQGTPPADFSANAPTITAALGAKSRSGRKASSGSGGSASGGSASGSGSLSSGPGLGGESALAAGPGTSGHGSGAGLSGGADAGIAVGAALAVGTGAALIYRRRRRARVSPGDQPIS